MDFEIIKKPFQFFSDPSEIQKSLCRQDNEFQVKIEELGSKIKSYSEDEDLEALKKLIEDNEKFMPFLRGYIEDAFVSALYLKNETVIEYYLENGLDITEGSLSDCMVELVKLSKFNLDEPPIEILISMLKHGVDPNSCEKTNYRTALHLAARQGNVQFARILVEFGADIDAIDKKKKSPLTYVNEKFKKKPKSVYLKDTKEYLESKGACSSFRGTGVTA